MILISHCGSIYILAPLGTFLIRYIIYSNGFECIFLFILFHPSSFLLSFIYHAFTYYSNASDYILPLINTNKTEKDREIFLF